MKHTSLARLGECCEIISGATPDTGNPNYWGGNIFWATPKDLSQLDGAYISDTPRKLTQAGLEGCAASILSPGSVLFSSRAPIGHVAINTVPMATNQGFKSFVPKSDRLHAKFLYHWLRANRVQLERLGNGATFKEVSKAIVSRIEIELPTLSEQRRIADILDRADVLRAKRRAALAQLDTLTQSIFLNIFGEVRARRWPIVTVGDLVRAGDSSIRTGPFGSQLLHSEFIDQGVAVLGIDNVVANQFRWSERRFISESKYQTLRRYTVHPGDVLITIMGTCGRCAVVPNVATKELFHVLFWLARTYARGVKPADTLRFDQNLLPKTAPAPPQTLNQLQQLEASLRERDEKLAELLTGRRALDDELASLRAQIAEIKAANTAQPDAHDYSEAETRDYFIDLLLKEAGWPLDKRRDREFEISGMPNEKGVGFVDYVLWGDDGKPLGLVEAKRTKHDARKGQQQAKLYADALEKQFGRRPVIFYSNGYEHWIWDDAMYPPRQVQGFYKKAELELLIQRRETRKKLSETPIDEAIVERHYQTRAIRRIGETFERDNQRKALVVMATGAGKTRTVIALVDQLMRANWAKRVLFLADRVALVKQAVGAFKRHLSDASPVNLVTEKEGQGRVYVSTYPTMMGLIDETRDGQRRFGPGHFDLIIIDEAHRSVYQKYGAIFEYFDSLLVGLTATPKDEIDRNTYRLFDLENRVPTDAYALDDAVKDGFLVPPRAMSVDLKFPRVGITYNELSEEEKSAWDALEWDDEGQVPNQIEAAAVNKWLFNEDTVDKVLRHLMQNGQTVAGGDRLGKTIVFAKNKEHAEFIVERFDKNYPRDKGAFTRAVHFKVDYAQNLIDAFSEKNKAPHIAVSVDMLDTGIDIPEIVNLVFFKPVRSKTKFWQMLGRGTRLCPDLFGPGEDKTSFTVFDFCQNLEFFSQDMPAADVAAADSLGKKLFKTRLGLIAEIDKLASPPKPHGLADLPPEAELRKDTAELLQGQVAAMNVNNFIVRPKRRLVEKYAKPEAWARLDQDAHDELAHDVAGLPAELDPEEEEAKRFDLLMLNLQLAVLRHAPGFAKLQERAMDIANLLAEKAAIPMVQQQMELILDLASDEWWQDVTVAMLEDARKRLRSLIKFIDKGTRRIIYTDFEDELGRATEVLLPGVGAPTQDFERFRAKARDFLRRHLDHVAVQKLRLNKPLTASDLVELERMLVESVGSTEHVAKARDASHGLGLFVRSLVGLDREAAKQAFAGFLSGKTLSANQIEFVDMIINHLTYNGAMDAGMLYESPYTDRSPRGIDGVFAAPHSAEIISILDDIRRRAAA